MASITPQPTAVQNLGTLSTSTVQQQLQNLIQTERALLQMFCKVNGINPSAALTEGQNWATLQ